MATSHPHSTIERKTLLASTAAPYMYHRYLATALSNHDVDAHLPHVTYVHWSKRVHYSYVSPAPISMLPMFPVTAISAALFTGSRDHSDAVLYSSDADNTKAAKRLTARAKLDEWPSFVDKLERDFVGGCAKLLSCELINNCYDFNILRPSSHSRTACCSFHSSSAKHIRHAHSLPPLIIRSYHTC